MRTWNICWLWVIVAACGVEPQATSDLLNEAVVEDELIAGAVVPVGQLPSTLFVLGHCSASKVGPRHLLLAGHCVRTSQGQVLPAFTSGRTLTLRHPSSSSGMTQHRVTIAATHLHPRMVQFCAARGCEGTAASAKRDAPDLALILVTEALSSIPTAWVDSEPVEAADAVTVVGFGCLTKVTAEDSDGKLRAKATRALSANSIVHPGSGYVLGDGAIEFMASNFAFTPGPRKKGSAPGPGLCPGDSGGPLYRIVSGKPWVVGVNASYTFANDNAGQSVTNWHSRVDAKARFDTHLWLTGLGVSTGTSCGHSSRSCPR